MAFQCPVCSCSCYQRVIVVRPDGSPYRTEFWHCLGCTQVFLEPALFAAAAEVPKIVQTTTGGAAGESLRLQSLQYRYWHARAKRAGGGMEPTTEAVHELRMRLDR